MLLFLAFLFTLAHAKSEREFSDWSSWSKCTECPDSKQIRRRNCLQRKCNGSLEEKQPCPYKKCGRFKYESFPFLWGEDQCLMFNDFKRWRNVKIYVQFVKQEIWLQKCHFALTPLSDLTDVLISWAITTNLLKYWKNLSFRLI